MDGDDPDMDGESRQKWGRINSQISLGTLRARKSGGKTVGEVSTLFVDQVERSVTAQLIDLLRMLRKADSRFASQDRSIGGKVEKLPPPWGKRTITNDSLRALVGMISIVQLVVSRSRFPQSRVSRATSLQTLHFLQSKSIAHLRGDSPSERKDRDSHGEGAPFVVPFPPAGMPLAQGVRSFDPEKDTERERSHSASSTSTSISVVDADTSCWFRIEACV